MVKLEHTISPASHTHPYGVLNLVFHVTTLLPQEGQTKIHKMKSRDHTVLVPSKRTRADDQFRDYGIFSISSRQLNPRTRRFIRAKATLGLKPPNRNLRDRTTVGTVMSLLYGWMYVMAGPRHGAYNRPTPKE